MKPTRQQIRREIAAEIKDIYADAIRKGEETPTTQTVDNDGHNWMYDPLDEFINIVRREGFYVGRQRRQREVEQYIRTSGFPRGAAQ